MAYTLHVDRGVPRIVAAAAAADPPNDPDVVALPGDAVTAEQVQRHNAQAAAMELAIVPLRASELVMLRDLAVAMRSLPWYVGPTDSLDAVCAFVKARFRAADARHRAVRRAYNAYHVAGSRRVYECTPDDTGLFPSHDVVSWATVRRRIQERRRARRSVSPTWSWGRDVTATTLATTTLATQARHTTAWGTVSTNASVVADGRGGTLLKGLQRAPVATTVRATRRRPMRGRGKPAAPC